MDSGVDVSHPRWRAPQNHGESLIDPPLSEIGALLAESRHFPPPVTSLGGDAWMQLRSHARQQLLDVARQYTGLYRDDLPEPNANAPFILAGHQPELFHPGVWFKNFVLSRLAKSHEAVAVNLVIDNDAPHSATIRVPTDSLAAPRIENIPLDQPLPEVAYESRAIQDASTFETFGARAADAIKSLIPEALIRRFWPSAIHAARATNNLGLALAMSRHRLEGEWGLKTWEAPLGKVCESDSFRTFLGLLLVRAGELRTVYNESLADFRRINRVRSKTHPVPPLAQVDDWLEMPFWIWNDDDPQRRRLFVRSLPNGVELTDRAAIRHRLPLDDAYGFADTCEAIATWSTAGVKLRPRALITTMFARLLLSDLFLHGIGGGKYDQLTDLIICRVFGVEPLPFLVLTATVRLPLDVPFVEPSAVQKTARTIRRMHWNPEEFLADRPDARALIDEKCRWLRVEPARNQRSMRRAAIRRINEQLRPLLDDARERKLAELESMKSQQRQATLLRSREFAFCLHPEKSLRELLLELSRKPS